MDDFLGPFLTDLDSRAQVKGSRDPLGAQSVWTRFGRHVIGNLTTVTNSVRDFTTLLLGYYFAERVAAELGPGSELATFLKWEQLAAYSRAYINRDYAFRGTERVQRTLNAGTRFTLSNGRASDQQTYGLWGLYSVSSAAAGLVEQDPARLTPVALEFVERFYLPLFRETGISYAERVVELLSRAEARVDLATKNDRALCTTVARILKRRILETERKFYHFHLVEGGRNDSTQGRQSLLAGIMEDQMREREVVWSPGLLRDFEKGARAAGQIGEPLAHRLERIRTCESVLAPASRLFGYLQGFDGKTVNIVAKRVRDEWGPRVRILNVSDVRALRAELAGIREDIADRWIWFAELLDQGEYARALRLLIEQNEAAMQTRGGAAWISDRGGRLHVRVRDEQGNIPAREELENSLAISVLPRFPASDYDRAKS